MSRKPLVSCLCVSNNRAGYLKKAISYFISQTYANKELIIVSAKHNREYEKILANYATEPIAYYGSQDSTQELTLGELRNLAIERSKGEYFCIWDDDDWFHYRRIEIQMREVFKYKKEGSILPFCMMFDSVNQNAYLSNLILPPGSILCKKSSITKDLLYPALNKAEDSYFLNNLFTKNILYPLINPVLYIYIYHGENTSGLAHFNKLRGNKLSNEIGLLINDVVENKYSYEHASRLLGSTKVLRELDYFKNAPATLI